MRSAPPPTGSEVRVRFGNARRGPSHRAVTLTVALAVVSVLLSACTAARQPSPVPHRPFVPPLPAGVSELPVSAPASGSATAETCNPLQSLRPPVPMPEPGAMPPGSTMRKITDRGRLIIGTDQNINLFSYLDPVSGEIVGFDVDIAREVVKALFGNDNDDHIQIVVLAADERFKAIRDGRVDIVADATTITCARLQESAFSTKYYDAGQRILTSRSSPIKTIADLDNRTVCSNSGTTSIGTIAAKAPKAKVISAKYWTDCLVLLQQGQTEAITTDDTILYGLAAQDPTLHVVGEQINPEPYGLVMLKSATDFVRFVNGVLERIRQTGTWRAIYEKWLPKPAPEPPAAEYLP
jgi:polar amino acid transport system substrate-binding protein